MLEIRATIDWLPSGAKKRPYRTLSVPAQTTLYNLAESIVGAFGFDFDHPFGFYDNMKDWTRSRECYELFADMEEVGPWFTGPNCTGVRKTTVSEVFREVGQRVLFLFDYGDEWHFILRFERTITTDRDVKHPMVVKSLGEPPRQYEAVEEE
jgi:hypothetical protein